jgi:hypothetical protein
MTETPLDNNSSRGASLEEVMTSSYNEEMLRHTLIDANKGRLDQFLNSEGLKRDEVPPHGNCFFEAACKSNLITESHVQLRTSL